MDFKCLVGKEAVMRPKERQFKIWLRTPAELGISEFQNQTPKSEALTHACLWHDF